MKNELQGIISGKNAVSHGAIIQSAARYLKRSEGAGSVAKNEKLYKAQEAEILKQFVSENKLWCWQVL